MKQKVAIVTGGSMGIGEAIVKQLVQDGFKVAVAARRIEMAENVAAQFLGEAKAYRTDVSKKAEVDQLIEDVVKDFGKLDVMINNAGISKEYSLLDMTEKQYDELWSTNVKGVLFGIQAAATQFIKQMSGGKIINASSIGGYKVQPSHGGYSSTKFAVRSLTQAAAKEFGKYNITTNCYCPGYVMTPMMEDIIENLCEKMSVTREELIASKQGDVALGRPAYPDDIAKVVSFLASDNANYINGQAVVIDGGQVYV